MVPRTSEEIKNIIQEKIQDAKIFIRDLTGTSDHWQVTVVSSEFEGQTMMDQHRKVQSFFKGDIASGAVHALSLKTYTPEQWVKYNE